MALARKSFDLRELLQHLCQDIKILADQKNIRLSFSSSQEILINGDEEKLKRLFVNILENAIKYTQAEGEVRVSIHRGDDRLKISVSDTGMGILEEELKHIFDRFYRVDKARSHGGFGLGLSIAKSIAEAHGGDIEVESILNKGTTFNIFLPV